jgi:hypothetical protein
MRAVCMGPAILSVIIDPIKNKIHEFDCFWISGFMVDLPVFTIFTPIERVLDQV